MSSSGAVSSSGVGTLTKLLPLAVIAAAVCLFASELMATFEFTPDGGEALLEQDGSDRHGYALALIAAFAVAAVIVAVLAGSRPAATAVAFAGVVALAVVLIADLPDANAVGTLDDPRQSYFNAEAIPREGFWLALVSSVALAVTGTALATLSGDQLRALRPGRRRSADAGTARSSGAGNADGPQPARNAERERMPSPGRRRRTSREPR